MMPVKLTLLTAGWTTHPAGIARRGAGRDRVRFPALVAVIEHPEGTVLFDTGYAPRIHRELDHGIDRIYGKLLPVTIDPDQTAAAQLRDVDRVTHVVLSHLHPDHIGGLRDFPASRVVVPSGAVAAAHRLRGLRRARSGLLPRLLPEDLADRTLDPVQLPAARIPHLEPFTGRDLFGDGSLVVVPLPGHSAGHLGLFVRAQRDVLLVGDAVWDTGAMTLGQLPHPVARIATTHWDQYRRTIVGLSHVQQRRPDVMIVPSHDESAIEIARGLLA